MNYVEPYVISVPQTVTASVVALLLLGWSLRSWLIERPRRMKG